ncbi:MAG: zinc ribbon domain-containing protein [Gammaproteobacteria bacterium]|nr:zinc ribbon domain-containing protein [Gammaproteobacteria bacterium]
MPIYEYQCTNCGHELEVLQKIAEEPLARCPSCKQDDLKKLVSASSFRLKGGGWYETDFKQGNKKHIADKGDSDPGSNKSSTDTKPTKNKTGDGSKTSSVKSTKTDAGSSK